MAAHVQGKNSGFVSEELQKIINMADLVEAGLIGTVVHGDGSLGAAGADDLVGRLAVDGIIPTHRDQHTVNAAEGILQLRIGEAADVAQMDNANAATVEDPDGIHAPLGAAALVMGSFKLRHRPGQGSALFNFNGLGEVVVCVAVAAIDGVGGQVQILLTGNHSPGIGIDDGLYAPAFQGKAGMTVVGELDFHKIPPEYKNALWPIRTEGDKIAVPPLVRVMLTHNPSRRLTTPSAVSGVPVRAYCDSTLSAQPLREVFRRFLLPPCTNRRLSGREGARTSSLRCVSL